MIISFSFSLLFFKKSHHMNLLLTQLHRKTLVITLITSSYPQKTEFEFSLIKNTMRELRLNLLRQKQKTYIIL